ncbi:MAG: DUF559 domain-containing protein [Micromonosporaceae bacterium]|nr:DUF559 domain-containing protein [Micromonosporaceae bacterium]
MTRRPYRPRELEGQIFLGTDAVDDGILTPNQLRSRAWVRLRHNVYADSRVNLDHEVACRAAALRLPSEAVFAGRSAAQILGVRHAARFEDDIDVVLPWKRRIPRLRGLRVHTIDLGPDDYTDWHGFRCTTPCRTAWDLACWLDVGYAVGMIDPLVGAGLITRDDLMDYLRTRSTMRGHLRAATAFAMVDGAAQSPPESHLRVRLVVAGLPKPVSQLPVRTVDGQLYHPDLAWPEYRVAVEYDGEWHANTEQFHRDRQRLNRLTATGWLVLHVTSVRLRSDFPGVLREVSTALKSRGWHR